MVTSFTVPLIYDNYIGDLKVMTPEGIVARKPQTAETPGASWQLVYGLHDYYKKDSVEQPEFCALLERALQIGVDAAREFVTKNLNLPETTEIEAGPVFYKKERKDYPPQLTLFLNYGFKKSKKGIRL